MLPFGWVRTGDAPGRSEPLVAESRCSAVASGASRAAAAADAVSGPAIDPSTTASTRATVPTDTGTFGRRDTTAIIPPTRLRRPIERDRPGGGRPDGVVTGLSHARPGSFHRFTRAAQRI